jgi:hypothetical protein
MDEFLDVFARKVAAIVLSEMRGGDLGMIDQHGSLLGSRRHCAAVRRRIKRGTGGAAIVGRRFLLSREALREELDDLDAPEPEPTGGKPRPGKGGDDAADIDEDALYRETLAELGH